MKTKPLSQTSNSAACTASGTGRVERRIPALTVPLAPAEPYIKKSEVARRLGVGLRLVESMMHQGKIPYYKFGYLVAFRWSEITEHLAKTCRVSPTAELEVGSRQSKAEALKS